MIVAEHGQCVVSWTQEHGGQATDLDLQAKLDAVLAEPASTLRGVVIENDEGGRIERRIVELQPGGREHAAAA